MSRESRRIRRLRIINKIRKTPPAPLAPPDTHNKDEVANMLREIGIALVEVNQPTPVVTARLQEIAARYTTETVRVVVLPTMLMIQIGDDSYQVDESTNSSLQLNKAGFIDDIAVLASVGAIEPADAIAAIKHARELPTRFGPFVTTLGYAITTIGFGMLINPTWASLPGYLLLGLVVGAIVQLGRPFPSLNPILPTLSAAVVTILAIWFVAATSHDGLLRVIAPSLVATLPGMALTIGAMELASTQLISGTSRLMYGIAQLALMVFGVALGLEIAGTVAPRTPSVRMGEWSLYAAVLVVAVGLYFYLSAPRGSLPWLMAAIGVAVLGQAAAESVMSESHSGFVGAVVSVPFSMLASRIKTSPPAIVMMLVSFWSLVPGALSFEALSQALAGGNLDAAGISSTGAAIMSIALGTLVGWSVFHTIDSRLPWPKNFGAVTAR
jgi:uncharacterized membrane protein YjjP (DUF1212 family)